MYVYADDIISSALTYILIHVDNADGLSHLHKYIWTLYVYADDIISSALKYILIHVDNAAGLSHLHKYIGTLYVYADDIISSALTYILILKHVDICPHPNVRCPLSVVP